MPFNVKKEISDLITFLNRSPTSWHAVDMIKSQLHENGFEELKEEKKWKLQSGKAYFVIRNGSSLCAFTTPLGKLVGANVVAAHTDSPSLKLKPNAEYRKENMVMIGAEVYGSPLLSSWLNRELGIAGRVVYHDKHSHIKEKLIRLEDHPLVIPQLAIHLDKDVNEKGLKLNKQDHLSAIAAIDTTLGPAPSYLEKRFKELFDFRSILSFDLFLFPLEPAHFIGQKNQMLASYRIDNLCSVHAGYTALLKAKKPHAEHLNMVMFWDHEEVGSTTPHGAASPFFSQVLERISMNFGLSREDYFRLLKRSLTLSVDLAHAYHPNYPEVTEPEHVVLLNRGIVLKSNSQQRYVTDGATTAKLVELCKKENLTLQKFVMRNDIRSGSTIGPLHGTVTGISTVDIGIPQLSMHSSRELIACKDHLDMCKLLTSFYNAG